MNSFGSFNEFFLIYFYIDQMNAFDLFGSFGDFFFSIIYYQMNSFGEIFFLMFNKRNQIDSISIEAPNVT